MELWGKNIQYSFLAASKKIVNSREKLPILDVQKMKLEAAVIAFSEALETVQVFTC